MTVAERKFWPWQFKRTMPLGARIARWIQRLFILGILIGLPTGTIALLPFVDPFVGGFFGGIFGTLVALSLKIAMLLLVIVGGVAYLTLAERRFAGMIQRRFGPNRVGWFGFLQPLADGVKFLFKEDVILGNVHKPLYIIAPMIILTTALTVFCVIPFGPPDASGANPHQLASVDVGILLIFALSSVGIYGIAIGGWSSFSKWSLFGGLRASAQMISYEVSLGLSVIGVLIFSRSFDLTKIVESQINGAPLLGFLPSWNIFTQGGGFIVFLVAMFAETNRLPFDLPEAEQELVGGYHTEYSSMKFVMFYFGEYVNMIVASSLIVLLFLGGWHVPGLEMLGLPALVANVIQIFGFLLKMFVILFIYIWARWTLPRFRYDQLMNLGWLVLLPVALGNIILTVIFVALFG